MSEDPHPSVVDSHIDLSLFVYERVLNEDPYAKTINLLGSYPYSSPSEPDIRAPAILILNKTHFDAKSIEAFVNEGLGKVRTLGVNDIYTWLLGWSISSVALDESKPDASTAAETDSALAERSADVKMTLIRNATEVHVRKYSRQKMIMVHETPDIYKDVVLPWVEAIPPERIQWVHNILEGKTKEAILLSHPSFVLLPDLKWDQTTLSSLYLVAISRAHGLRSIRDLRKAHVGVLKDIRRETRIVLREKWGLGGEDVRMYLHYPPSYYHLHVHIVALTSVGGGMNVGQAHLLDDVISLLELDAEDGSGLFERRTLTYVIGEQHGLYRGLVERQTDLEV